MSNKLPFEDAFERQLKDLSSPDQEASWQQMKHLLDENERAKRPVFFRRIIPWTVAAILLLTGGGYFIHIQNTTSKNTSKGIAKNGSGQDSIDTDQTTNNKQNGPTAKKGCTAKKTSPTDSIKEINNTRSRKSSSSASETRPVPKTAVIAITNNGDMRSTVGRGNTNRKNKATNYDDKAISISGPIVKVPEARIISPEIAKSELNASSPDSLVIAKTNSELSGVKTSLEIGTISKDTASLPIKELSEQESIAGKKIAISNSKKFVVSAGLGFQQQIPVAGQKTVSVGYNGKSTISDYIPSVFLRLERNKKWFLQTEFIYAAPQLVNKFSYFRQTTADTSSLKETSLNLKKTFFSEMPVTVNYYVQPNWSLGVGGMYGWFHGAIAEKEVTTSNLQTQQSTVVTETTSIKGFTDSFLYKSHTYLLLQTDYEWRSLSLGVRYAKDIEPYIKYTLPDGTVQDQRNWSLELILRLKLWKSVK